MNISIINQKQKFEKLKQDQNIYKAKMESLLISQLELLSELDEDVDFKSIKEEAAKEDPKEDFEKKIKEKLEKSEDALDE